VYLRTLCVENYRAVRHATLSFDDTTVLIGENHCGMSSLLDALEQVLAGDADAPRFAPFQFHRENAASPASGPIRIRLTFAERGAGEWSASEYAPLAPLLPSPQEQPRELQFELTAAPVTQGESTADWKLQAPGSNAATSDPQLLHWLRRTNPVIRVTAGMLTGHGIEYLSPRDYSGRATSLPPEMTALVERIESAASALLSGKSTDMDADLEAGFAAARELIALSAKDLDLSEFGLTRSVGEILGWETDEQRPAPSTAFRASGSTTERLGILLLIAALLRASPEGLIPEVDPIWVIEDPEAHLHPMTLASVALLVGHIQWQKIVTTYSGDLLAVVPLRYLRRLTRHDGVVYEHSVGEHALSLEHLRRVTYHLRARHGVATFARLWILVEGESEFWVVPQVARLLGYDFDLEGISCVEFAQCGVEPLIKVADALGIEWHMLADGDEAGRHYLATARRLVGGRDERERITILRDRDIERCFWHHGYADVYRHHAGLTPSAAKGLPPGRVIQRAVKRRSKPYLALSVVEAAAKPDSAGVPKVLRRLIETSVRLARAAPARLAASGQPNRKRDRPE